MARLVISSAGFADRVIELNLGVNRFGRGPGSDFEIDHPTVSARHCEMVLAAEGMVVRDCASTNGTFVGGQRIEEASLWAGQSLNMGEVELLVETTDVPIVIPKFDLPRPAPPVVMSDGSLLCPRHGQARATHQCTHCREVLCDACVHWLRRKGGQFLRLCPLCSYPCVPIGGEEKAEKKSLLARCRKALKLLFLPGSKLKPPEFCASVAH